MKLKILCLILLFTSQLSAQEFTFQVFSVKDGLAQSQVNALIQDQQGYLWAGTQGGGLCRFDGDEFKTYSERDGLSNNVVSCLGITPDGIIWIGTNSGLCWFDGIQFSSIPQFQGISINQLSIDSKGQVWIGCENGIFHNSDKNIFIAISDQLVAGKAVYSMCESSTVGVWIANSEGIFRISYEDNHAEIDSINYPANVVSTLYEDSQQQLWIGRYGEGLEYWNGNQFLSPSGIPDRVTVLNIHEFDGKYWLGTQDRGLMVWDGEQLELLDDRKGLPNNQVRSLITDSWNNLWVGTSGGGLARYYGQQILCLNRDSGLPGRQVYSIEEGFDGKLWLGVADKGLVRFDPVNQSIIPDSTLTSGKVKCQFTDELSRIWCGTEGNGITVFEADTIWTISGEQGLSGAWVRAICQDAKQQYWIGTAGGGITRLIESSPGSKQFSTKVFNRHSGLRDDRINTLLPDSLGRIWFGTESGGLGVILEDETVISFVQEVEMSGRNIRSLAIDDEAWLWIGSGDEGVSSIDLRAEKLSIIPLPSELQPNPKNVYLVSKDNDRHIWVGTNNGIYRYSRNTEGNLEIIHVGKEEGFQGIETCTNADYLDRNGNLWIGTVDGVNCIFPKKEPQKSSAPLASLNDISLFYKSLKNTELSYYIGAWGLPKDTLVFTYDQNHLGFDLKGLRLSDPENILYQWWMVGYDSTWTPLLSSNSATFSNLKPGDYSFRFRACTKQGMCDEAEAIHFKILSPYWQKANFKIGVGSALFALFILFFVWRIKVIKRKSKEKTNRLKLQNQVLELEQQALRLQMNPHFIFNTLNSIQGLISLKDTKEARRQLSDFSQLMRSTLENSREEAIPLSEELEACKRYANLERTARGLDFELEIDDQTDGDRWIPPLILQPFIENSIVHGFKGLTKAGRIYISCKEINESLVIEIRDNGLGRKHTENKSDHNSLGVKVTRERIESGNSGGSLTFEDLYEEGKATGTSVHLRFTATHDA